MGLHAVGPSAEFLGMRVSASWKPFWIEFTLVWAKDKESGGCRLKWFSYFFVCVQSCVRGLKGPLRIVPLVWQGQNFTLGTFTSAYVICSELLQTALGWQMPGQVSTSAATVPRFMAFYWCYRQEVGWGEWSPSKQALSRVFFRATGAGMSFRSSFSVVREGVAYWLVQQSSIKAS